MPRLAYPITCTAAAGLLGCAPSTVTRRAISLGLGVVAGPVRVLSENEVDQLRGTIREKAGNPNFVPGNHFGKPPKKSRKNRKKTT